MKVIWEANDVYIGRVVGLPNTKEKWIIGYNPNVGNLLRMYVIISLSDGLIVNHPTTKTVIASQLNDLGYQPVELLEKELK